jgi:phosphatidylglycerophosphate synthase
MAIPGYSALVKVLKVQNFNILGLTLLERTFIALEKAGVTDVFLIYPSEGSIHLKPPFRAKNLRFHHFSRIETELARQIAVQDSRSGVFFLPEPLVVDLSVLEDMKKALSGSTSVLAEGGGVVLFEPVAAKSLPLEAIYPGMLESGLKNPVVVPLGQRICAPVNTEEALQSVKKQMIKNLTKPSDGLVSRNINRVFSTAISQRLTYSSITPNQMTVFTGLIAFIPCYFMYQGGYVNWLIGAAVYQLASMLDGVDGEIARLKMQSSRFGQWLDTLLDFVSMIAVLLCLVIGVHRAADQPAYIRWAGKLAILFSLLGFLGLVLFVVRFKKEGSFNIQYSFLKSDSKWAKAIKAVDFLGKRDFYIFLFLILALFGQMPWALIYVGGFAMLIFFFIVQAHFQTKKIS